MKLGQALKKYRQDKGLSISKMAEEVGVTHDDYESVELGGSPTPGVKKWLAGEAERGHFQDIEDYKVT